MNATCLTHPILCNLINLLFGEKHKLWYFTVLQQVAAVPTKGHQFTHCSVCLSDITRCTVGKLEIWSAWNKTSNCNG